MIDQQDNASLQSLDRLAQVFAAETFNIRHIWRAFGRILDESNATVRFRDDSWEQDWLLAKYASEVSGIGISGHYLAPRDFYTFPSFDIDKYVEGFAHLPGHVISRSRARVNVSALFDRQERGSTFVGSNPAEFYALQQRIEAHGDRAMTVVNHTLAWLHLALGKLFTGIALTPWEHDLEALTQMCGQRWSRVWEQKDLYEEYMSIPELIQWKLDVFYGAEIQDVGLAMQPSRQGQPLEWREHWQWISAPCEAQAALDGVRMAARLMMAPPVCIFLQQLFRSAADAVTTGHLLAVAVFRRWTLQLLSMLWLETALQREWKDLRPQDVVSFAFSVMRPHWPRRLFGLSHRSMDVKAALAQTPAWNNFRYSIDATFVPNWETNVATVWGLFSSTPGVIRVESEHYDDSVWCRRERELFDYLRDQDDFLDGRYLIEVPHIGVQHLGATIADESDEPAQKTMLTRNQFPRLTTVFRVFPFELWESQILAVVAAARMIHLRLLDPELTNAACMALANGRPVPEEFVPLTNHPDGWSPLVALFGAFLQRWGDTAERFPIAFPDTYEPAELKKDTEMVTSIINLQDGTFDQVDVLAACEWNRTIVPALVGDHRYGSFFCIDYRNLTEQMWARDEAYMVIRGINRVRTQVPLWFLQGEDQRVDEWKTMGTNPVLTQHVERQWDWMMEALQEPDWPANFQSDCKVKFSQKLSEACAATTTRGVAYYQGKIN